jgi:competence protein ComEC
LKGRGVKEIDLLVVTHFHPDHAGGIPTIMAEFAVGRIILGPERLDGDEGAQIIRLAEDQGAVLSRVGRGEEIGGFDGVSLRVMHPDGLPVDPNNASIVLKITFKEVSVLLASDILPQAEEDLVSHFGGQLACDILKVPHHGNKTTKKFVKAVHPAWAVVSVGPNPWGAPVAETLKRYKDIGSQLLRTDMVGHVVFTTDGYQIRRGPN